MRLGYSLYVDPLTASQRQEDLKLRIENNLPRYRSQTRELITTNRVFVSHENVSFDYTLKANVLLLEYSVENLESESRKTGLVLPWLLWSRASVIITFMAEIESEIWPTI
jgi:hypothetical protein